MKIHYPSAAALMPLASLLLAAQPAAAASRAGAKPGPTAPPAEESVRFTTEDGWSIVGLYRQPKPGKAVAILVHGAQSSRSEWRKLSAELWKLGLGTLAIDLRGHGQSLTGPAGQADWKSLDASGSWGSAEQDIRGALDLLARRKIPASRAGLIGASMGANLASRVADRAAWTALLSPGRDYRGVPVQELKGPKVLLAASREDAYAYQTALVLSSAKGGPAFLEGGLGHGAQMCEDADFLKRLLGWIAGQADP